MCISILRCIRLSIFVCYIPKLQAPVRSTRLSSRRRCSITTQYIHYPNGNGVTSINGLIGAITLAAGTGISLTPAGNTITIASTGAPSFPLLAPNDSAAAPSYSWANSTGLGLYRFAPNVLGIVAPDLGGANATHISLSNGAASGLVFGIAKDRTDTILNLSGGGGYTDGGNISLFGSTIGGGNNNLINFRQGTTVAGSISGTQLWTIGASGSSQNHVLNGNSLLPGTDIQTDLGSSSKKFATVNAANLVTTGHSSSIAGTNTNDNASAGVIGEYIESVISSHTNFPGASTVWGNMTSISLTAGDWDVTGISDIFINGAIMTNGESANEIAISVNSGATTTDQVPGSNQIPIATAATATNRAAVISAYRLSLAGTTTVYFKILSTYSVATPQYTCRLSARRMR